MKNHEKLKAAYQIFIVLLALLSIIPVILDLCGKISLANGALFWTDTIILIIFAIDYIVRFILAKGKSQNSFQHFVNVASQIEFAEPSVVSNSLDNLSRLGLIKIDNALVEKKHYEEIDNNPLSKKLYRSAELYIKNPSNEKLHFEKNSMSMTALGRMFYSICNGDIV